MENIHKTRLLDSNNAFTLRTLEHVQRMLDDYQEAFEDLGKVDVLELNNAFPLRTRENVKRMLHDYQGFLKNLD